jgi:hypothetical protein
MKYEIFRNVDAETTAAGVQQANFVLHDIKSAARNYDNGKGIWGDTITTDQKLSLYPSF